MKKFFLITTGGSGGHVLPAKILYEHLSSDANIIISSDKRGLKYLEKDIYQLYVIDTPKLNNFFFLPFNLVIILFLTIKSFFLLRKKRIEKIFSTGGYMSLPLILAARLINLEIYLVEPNQVLGRANRYFLNLCKKIFCYRKKIKNFPDNFKNKIVNINPLVKKYIYKLRTSSKKKNKFTLLIVGGSQGANIFDNEWDEPAYQPYKFFERGGVKIAVIGQAFPYLPIANPSWMFPNLSFGIREERIATLVDEVKSLGAALIVLLSHNGFDVDRKLASRVKGINVILTGHTHDALPVPIFVDKTMLIASGSNGKFVSRLDLDVQNGEIKKYNYKLIPIF